MLCYGSSVAGLEMLEMFCSGITVLERVVPAAERCGEHGGGCTVSCSAQHTTVCSRYMQLLFELSAPKC